jgi:hypothetical protein
MGNPDDPDLVVSAERCSLGNEGAVPGNDYLRGIDADRDQDILNGARPVLYHPDALIRQNDSHDRIILGVPGA